MDKIEIFKVISFVTLGLSVSSLLVAIVLFIKLKIPTVVQELTGRVPIREKKYNTNAKSTGNILKKENDNGAIDETKGYTADDNTYLNFNVVKRQISVNTRESIKWVY